MGAMAGGAAGFYGGNKMGHGIIGTLAGAFLGSKAEDAMKDRRHEQQQQQSYGQPGQYQQGGHHHHHHQKRDGEGW